MRVALLTALVVLGVVAPAHAQTAFLGTDTGRIVESRSVPVDVSGSISVDWTGDPAGGCEAAGLCAEELAKRELPAPEKAELTNDDAAIAQ